jgi:hypothetical protein
MLRQVQRSLCGWIEIDARGTRCPTMDRRFLQKCKEDRRNAAPFGYSRMGGPV